VGQYVTVGIGAEVFALDVARVREVLDLCPFTRVPNMPDFVRGMIDVRGHGVPVVDLRQRFGLPPVEPDAHTRIVVLEVDIAGRPLVIGALTDRVYEVVEVANDAVEAPPEVGVRWRSDVIRGIGRRGGNFVIMLDLDRLFGLEGTPLLAAPA
jgi:purine-binding chemotaxis protein CheW